MLFSERDVGSLWNITDSDEGEASRLSCRSISWLISWHIGDCKHIIDVTMLHWDPTSVLVLIDSGTLCRYEWSNCKWPYSSASDWCLPNSNLFLDGASRPPDFGLEAAKIKKKNISVKAYVCAT